MKYAVLALLFLAGADGPQMLQESGPAKLSTNAARSDGNLVLRFSEFLVLTIRVEGDEGLEVEPPSTWTQSPGWRGKSVEKATVRSIGRGRVAWEQSFTLDPLATGDQQVELNALRHRQGKTPWQTARWQPFSVKVTSQIKEPDAKNLREHTPVEDPPALLPSRSHTWIYVAGAVMVGLVVCVLLWRRRGRIAARRTPTELALYELDRLRALRLPEQGKTEEFHTLLANVVRRFLEKHQLPARRQTTLEFLANLNENPTLSAEQRTFLEDFLKRCDLAKFAHAQVSRDEAEALLRKTRAFLQSAP